VHRYGHGAASSDHPEGGQADGLAGGRRSCFAAAQVRLLHEGHGPHVSLPVAGENHPVSGHALSQGAQQGDDQ